MIKKTDPHHVKQLTPDRTSLRISMVYLCFSVIWILLGDHLLLLFVQDPGTMTTLQTYKGLLFVSGSMLLIFILVKNALTHADHLQQLLREEEEKYRLLVENQNDLVVKVDADGRFLYVSPSYCATFGKSEEQLLGQAFMPLVHEEDREPTLKAMERLYQEPYHVYLEQRALTVSGWRWLGWSDRAIVSEHGDITAVVGVGRDITERRIAETAVRQKSEEMERFVYTISHDLKSPLVTVESFLGMLRSDLKAADQERIEADIDYIQAATNKIKDLLGALLQLSRIGRMDNPPETLEVDTLISECLKTLAGSIHQRGIDVDSAATGLTLYGDRLRLGQLWQNLIDNAIKYMGKQPQPRITLGIKLQDSETIFFVRDNGIGIAPDNTERIFGIFTRVDPTAPGSGLGLALVKKIVEVYQGRIWVESKGIGHGSCFYFTLPEALADYPTE